MYEVGKGVAERLLARPARLAGSSLPYFTNQPVAQADDWVECAVEDEVGQ